MDNCRNWTDGQRTSTGISSHNITQLTFLFSDHNLQETAAATKIQSVWRKDKVMADMDRQGFSTSAIRNRRRRRKAAQKNQRSRAAQSGDVPSIFQCCAVGLAFGDATEDDEDTYRELQKKRYEERQKQQAAHEEALRKKFLREKGDKGTVIEAVEVVE
jgi:hypothetical protein